jgi:hypothetical protein
MSQTCEQRSQSQWNDDLRLLPMLACAAGGSGVAVPAGTFVELGAYDGYTHSNTIMLEKCFAWRGLLIEASPTNFALLASSGRSATKLHTAVCEPAGETNISVAGGEVGGDPAHMHAHQLHKFDARFALRSKVARVPCARRCET